MPLNRLAPGLAEAYPAIAIAHAGGIDWDVALGSWIFRSWKHLRAHLAGEMAHFAMTALTGKAIDLLAGVGTRLLWCWSCLTPSQAAG